MEIQATGLSFRDLARAIDFARADLNVQGADDLLLEYHNPEDAPRDREPAFIRTADADGAGFRIAQIVRDEFSPARLYQVRLTSAHAGPAFLSLASGLASQA